MTDNREGADRYQSQRERLERLLAHLTRRTSAVERDLRRQEGPLDKGFEEQAVEVENDDVLAKLASEGPQQIGIVRAALDRMDSGDYGVCASCGRPIPQARLEALPYAIRCVRCEEQRESGTS